MYIQKKNGVWWLREYLTGDKDGKKTLNRNLGKNYKFARSIVIEELEKVKYGEWADPKYKKGVLDKMEETEKKFPSFVTLKIPYRLYEKIKSHLPPELRNL